MEQNVNELRKKRLEEIGKKVYDAYVHRKKERYQSKTRTTVEALEEARKTKARLEERGEETVISAAEYVEKDHEVVVDNPYDYRDLLTTSLLLLADNGYFNRNNISTAVETILEHEYEHHVPVLGQDGVRVLYGVSFIEDYETSFRGIRPFVSISGRITVGLYNDFVNAVKNPSATDREKSLKL